MFVTQTRDCMDPCRARVQMVFPNGSLREYPQSSWLDTIGTKQTITTFRSRKKPNRVQRMLNPHPCTISKVEGAGTSEIDHRMIRYDGGSGYLYYPSGDIAAVMARPQANPDPRFGKLVGNLLPLEQRFADRMLINAYGKAKQPKFDGSTNLGELKETVKALLNPLSGIRSLFKRFTTSKQFSRSMRKRGRDVADQASHITGQWLEYRYGIMPLVLTAQDLIETVGMHPTVSGGFLLQQFNAGDVMMIEQSKVIEEKQLWVVPFKVAVETSRVTRVGSSVCARLAIDEGRLYGLRLVDVPSTAWELVTLSFVVDWFFNVGDWIRAITPDPKIKVLASSVSIARTYEATMSCVAHKLNASSFAPMPDVCEYRYSNSVLTRVVNPNLPVLPVWDDTTLSWMRQLDAVSLGWGKLFGTLKRKKII